MTLAQGHFGPPWKLLWHLLKMTLSTAVAPNLNILPSISNVIINGNGLILKRGAGIYGRFFQINNATIKNMTFDGGSSLLTGGGLFCSGENVLENCLFINNVAGTGQNVGQGSGGALRVNSGTTTINNSIFTNNSAQNGAAIRSYNSATLTLNNCTFSGNMVDPGNSVTASTLLNEGTLNFTNTIIANTLPQGTPDLYDIGQAAKTIGINENNLVEICGGYGCEPVAFTADPQLGPLQNNGGSTLTFNFLPTSPFINAGIGAVTIALPATVPTLGQWSIICLALILIIFGIVSIRQAELKFS